MAFFNPGYDIEYGRHSNIPECCIEFWVQEFSRIFQDPKRLQEHNEYQDRAEMRIKKRFNYRPCYDCMDRGYIQRLHVCRGRCEDMSKRLMAKYGLRATPWRRVYVQGQS